MGTERPGRAHYATATKVAAHNGPAVENGIPGQAVKTKAAKWSDGFTAAPIAIPVGEDFTIRTKGIHEFPSVETAAGRAYDISAGTSGAAVYINTTNNALALAAGANLVPFGRIVGLPNVRGRGVPAGRVRIDIDQKDTVV